MAQVGASVGACSHVQRPSTTRVQLQSPLPCPRTRAHVLLFPAPLLRRHKGWRVPAALRTAATLAVLLLVAHVTFWRACHRWGITQSSLESVAGGVAAAGHVLGMNA